MSVSETYRSDVPVIEDVIAALTEPAEGGTRAELREQMERAAREFDDRAAESVCKGLLERLAEDPSNVRALETLMIMGLAHPQLLERHRIPIVQEGRRLAVLLERAGEVERAQTLLDVLSTAVPLDRGIEGDYASMMQRNGNYGRLIDRYLRRAEEAVAGGRRREAVTWLREALALDRSRRDVARMIRDLRYEETETKGRLRRRLRVSLFGFTFAALVGAVTWREFAVRTTYASIPAAVPGDLASLRARLQAVDRLIEGNVAWLGVLEASRDRADLRAQVARIEFAREREARAERAELERRRSAAEDSRQLGRLLAERRDFAGALAAFREALASAPEDWSPRARVEADVEAILGWQAEQARTQPGGTGQ